MREELEPSIGQIETRKTEHYALARSIMQADGGNMFPLDTLALAVVKRSLSNGAAMAQMIRADNYLCAASIARLQLDSCLRLYAAFLVHDPHQFATDVLAGTSVRNLLDRSGKKMTDRHLSEELGKLERWVPTVYNNLSGFIHLSNKHIFATFDPKDEYGHFEGVIGPGDPSVPLQHWQELADCFDAETGVIFNLLRSWVATKNDPSLVASAR